MAATPLRRSLSLAVGWLADRRVPTPLRGFVYGAYCRATGADAREAELEPRGYPSLGAFFVRRLKAGARTVEPDPLALPSPCDGRVQTVQRIEDATLVQAKGMPYAVEELLGSAADAAHLRGGSAWTIYLSPRDYHRVHAPLAAALAEVRWFAGARRSVAPKVLERVPRVLPSNERAVLVLEDAAGPLWLVMVGALNVGRIRVVGVPPGTTPARASAPRFERGAELARFEMGSTVVLLAPPGGPTPLAGLAVGDAVRLGQAIGRFPAGMA